MHEINPSPPATSWQALSLGMTESQVRTLLGQPIKIDTGDYAIWWYGGLSRVSFAHGTVCHWSEPSR